MVNRTKTDWESEIGPMTKAAVGDALQRPQDAWVIQRSEGDAEADYNKSGYVYVRRISPDNPEYIVARIIPDIRRKLVAGMCVKIQLSYTDEFGCAWEVIGLGSRSFEQFEGTTPDEGASPHDHQTEAGGGTLDAAAIATGTLDDARLPADVVYTDDTQTLTNKTLTAPVIADFTSAQHDHSDADDGGTLSAAVLTSGTLDAARLPTSGVTPGSYTAADITVDTYGRVTAAASGTGSTFPASPAKGDMIVYNGSAWVKHDAGTDGQFITYDSAESTGIKNISLTPSDLGTLVVTTETHRKMVSLVDTTLGSNGAFDESSIDQTYDHLEGELYVRGAVSAATDLLILWLNNDTTAANYHSQRHAVDNATVDNSESDNSSIAAQIVGDTAFTDSVTYIKFYIPFYTNAKVKTVRLEGYSYKAANSVWMGAALVSWESTAAINRIMFRTDNHATDLFLTGSRLRIWGVKNGTVVTNVELV
jgi:hypothetical protein